MEWFELVEWKMRNGDVILVGDMDDHHLIAAIAMIRRNALKKVVCSDSESWENLVCEEYWAMCYTALKRGLEI
jgi:hypothetical protein